jgi:hypothetical protein
LAKQRPGSVHLATCLLVIVLSAGVAAPKATASPPAFRSFTHQFTLLKPLDPDLNLGRRNPDRIAAGALPLRGPPISYVIDQKGLVAGYLVGAAKWDSPEARRFLDYFLHPPQEAR